MFLALMVLVMTSVMQLCWAIFLISRAKTYTHPHRLNQRLHHFFTPLKRESKNLTQASKKRDWIPFYTWWQDRNKQAQLEQQLPEVLDSISRALRAGHSLSVSLNLAGQDAAEPLGSELTGVVEGLRYGRSLEDCLYQLMQNLANTDIRFVVVAILVQRETGGNLAELLARVAHTLRARLILKGHIHSRSAEGKLSALILSSLPILLLVWISYASPHALHILTSDPMGQRLGVAACVALVIGSIWVARIAQVRV
jgi:tight adherence protein B